MFRTFGPPGTGKTTSMLDRVDRALASGIPPSEIAFLAFTRKAASEARERAAQEAEVSRLGARIEEAVGDGTVWEFEFDNTLNFVRNLGQYSFPHGIDIKFGMSAVTEYGRSTVVISEIGCASP